DALSQRKYATEIIERAYMVSCNSIRTPVDTESKRSDDGDSVSDPTLYRSLAGSLQYLTFTPMVFLMRCSSTEAEYRGVANVVAETYWLRNLLLQHQRTKHIEIDIHFVRDLVAVGQVRVLHVPSRHQYANIFTKGLSSALFKEFRTSLSVRCPPAQTPWECYSYS
nr:ribonuclease H-like domain-containing protein [Tanacetum cinerariifolium]